MNQNRRKDWKQKEMCFRAAEELGLLEKVLSSGWPALSAGENGRIGALVRRYRREEE